MNRRWVLISLFSWMALLLATPVFGQDETSELMARTNNLRASLGLLPYNYNAALAAAAQQQAQWIVDSGTVSHARPDGSGPRSRALGAGYPSADVTENIYGGTMASVDVAWTFWINSGVHYAGLTNTRYSEIGAGVAHGAWGGAYVLVFGNPGGPPPIQPGSNNSGQGQAAAAPPSYVVGQDEHGNIMHEVQPGDTLGDIALIYGYTWDDIPYMMQLNGLIDNRELEIGSIFLVPPQDGTYTPTPGELIADSGSEPTLILEPSSTPSAAPSPTPVIVSTSAEIPDWLRPSETPSPEIVPTAMKADAATKIALASADGTSIPVAQVSGGTIVRSGQSPWIIIAVVFQVIVLLAAGFEFIRRSKR